VRSSLLCGFSDSGSVISKFCRGWVQSLRNTNQSRAEQLFPTHYGLQQAPTAIKNLKVRGFWHARARARSKMVALDHIQSLPTAQKRTATFKKYVHVDTDWIYKGPYASRDDKYLVKAENSSRALKYLESLLDISDKDSSLLPIKEVLQLENQFFLVYENIGCMPTGDDIEVVDTKIDKKVPVIKRSTYVMRVSELEKKEGITKDIIRNSLQHLYFRYAQFLAYKPPRGHRTLTSRRTLQVYLESGGQRYAQYSTQKRLDFQHCRNRYGRNERCKRTRGHF